MRVVSVASQLSQMHKWVEVAVVQVAQASPSWVALARDLVESAFHSQFQAPQLPMPQVEMVMITPAAGYPQEQVEPVMVVVLVVLVVLA
jgi:hypothetical protein